MHDVPKPLASRDSSRKHQAAPIASHDNKNGEIKVKMENEVREKLRSEIYIIKRKKGQAAKYNVWDQFSEIVAAADNSSIGYVCQSSVVCPYMVCFLSLFNVIIS